MGLPVKREEVSCMRGALLHDRMPVRRLPSGFIGPPRNFSTGCEGDTGMLLQDFHTLSNGGEDWTQAFAAAIAQLAQQGGGELTLTPGTYLTGAILLRSHMTLHIQAGATLGFIADEDAYPVIALEFEGVDGSAHHPCLFARDAEYVRVTGEGTIDGQGAYWWAKFRNKDLRAARPYLICFSNCRHVSVENVRLVNSPVWTVHPLKCGDVAIRGVRITNPPDSPNTDGVNPNACSDVLVSGCTIDVGDDCIAIKSGTEDTRERRPCERITIRDCTFIHGHGGVVMGSEMSGGIRNVVISNCVFCETDRGIRIKTRRGRGGSVEGIRISDLIMDQVMCPFVVNMYYFCGAGGKLPRVRDKAPYPVDGGTPSIGGVSISNVRAVGCSACAGFLYGLPESPITGVSFRDVTVEMGGGGEPEAPAMMDNCPRMKEAGLFLRNVRGLDVSGLAVTGARGETVDMDNSVEMTRRDL